MMKQIDPRRKRKQNPEKISLNQLTRSLESCCVVNIDREGVPMQSRHVFDPSVVRVYASALVLSRART